MPLRRFRQLSIRDKLLSIALLPLLVVLPLLGLILLWLGNSAFDRLLLTKVRSDLAVAHGYFERVRDQVGASTSAVAESHALHEALAAPSAETLVPMLRALRTRGGLDFVNLRAPDGRIVVSDRGEAGEGARDLPMLEDDDEAGTGASVELLAPERQPGLGEALRARIAVPLLATRNAARTARAQEDRAMVLLATRAVRDADGTLRGRVEAGVLLNRNLAFIDHINEIVYPEGSLPFGSQGTATVFLDDVRVSTNVRLFGGEGRERAIGTRVSRQVRDAVLGRGATWLDRAFVVNDWYVSAYEPIADRGGRRIGMLYVGLLESPFVRLKYGVLALIGAVFFAVMIAAALVSLRLARAIYRPIERMEATMHEVEAGTLAARVGPVEGGDEIARLAAHLDRMIDTLQRWNAGLDAKVAERTQQLKDAQAQLVRSEKLATVGQLTASIAHEVNNPIAVIQGNLDLVRELLGAATVQRVGPELKLIDQQVERMRLIVTQLLQFARPAEFAGYVETLAPAEVVEDCLVLVAHLLARTRIEVRRDFRAQHKVAINRQELQQVLVNLLVNAVHAMAGGGTLALATRDAGGAEGDRVEIEVADSGPGLTTELMAQLFQPFVTRKREGTGLGLWISRGIVERYGGDIRAANRGDGPGARFTVVLAADAAG